MSQEMDWQLWKLKDPITEIYLEVFYLDTVA